MLISISGVDCSGKTTQIEIMKESINLIHSSMVFWYRPGYSRELDGLRRMVRRAAPGSLPAPGQSARRDEVFGRRWVQRLWLAVAVADMALQYGVKLRIRLLGRQWMICDRFVEDGLIDLALKFPGQFRRDGRAARWLRKFCPAPDHAFLLMLSEAEQDRRLAQKNEPFTDFAEIRLRRRDAYRELAASGRVAVIDANRSVGEVFNDIWTQLELMTPAEAHSDAR